MPKTKYSKEEQQKHQPYEVFVGTQPLENAPFTWKKVSGYEKLAPAKSDFELILKNVSAMSREDLMDKYDAPRIDVEILDQKGKLICWFGLFRKEETDKEKKDDE